MPEDCLAVTPSVFRHLLSSVTAGALASTPQVAPEAPKAEGEKQAEMVKKAEEELAETEMAEMAEKEELLILMAGQEELLTAGGRRQRRRSCCKWFHPRRWL